MGERDAAAVGAGASTVRLPHGPWPTVLDFLCERFAAIGCAAWRDRMARGRVLDADGRPLGPGAPAAPGLLVRYFREVAAERPIAARESLVHVDDDLVVADKPHFLPVMPAGGHVEETLVGRLRRRLGNPDLVALHRLDRLTAGLVLLSPRPSSRAAYQALFRERRIAKRYHALAPPLHALAFPLVRSSRLVRGEPFFRVREAAGPPNAETRVDVLERGDAAWRYSLEPVTGRKHQLRVHLAALGAPIFGDPCYPTLRPRADDDLARPLALLARELAFVDPLTGAPRRFASGLELG